MCVPRRCYCDGTVNSGPVVALVEHATKGKKHAETVALRHYLHNIKLKILFVWVGNETFAHWRQLPGSLWAGGVRVCPIFRFVNPRGDQ